MDLTKVRFGLEALCGRLEQTFIAKPFTWQGWNGAANGHGLALLKPAGTEFAATKLPIGETIARAAAPSYVADWSDLVAWAREGGEYVELCSECDGVGFTDCGHCGSYGGCGTCDGDGVEIANHEPAMIGEVRFNRRLLWHYLRSMPTTERVLVSIGGKLEPLAFTCADDRWRVYIMPMRESNDPAVTFPRGILRELAQA